MMKLLTEDEARINEAVSNANADYGRAVVLFQHNVMTTQEFIRIINTISQTFINAVNSVKVGDDND